MSKAIEKRQAIFDYFRSSINLLIDNGLWRGDRDVYLCPICLKQHKTISEDDPLTLEDAPPKSLGGSANVLTCKSCNNTAGYKIDAHLVERLRELDSASFTPGTETKVQIKVNGETLQGIIQVLADGTLQITHSKKNNHPGKLKKAMDRVSAGMKIDLNFFKSRVIPENLEYALLKTGYLLAFQTFGYSLILNKCFNTIREQLRNPEKRIYPHGFWLNPPYPKSLSGVYFVMDKGIESLLALFNLDTGNTQRMFGVLLPLPIRSIDEVIVEINKRFDQNGAQELALYPKENETRSYITDIAQINAMMKWIYARITNKQIAKNNISSDLYRYKNRNLNRRLKNYRASRLFRNR